VVVDQHSGPLAPCELDRLRSHFTRRRCTKRSLLPFEGSASTTVIMPDGWHLIVAFRFMVLPKRSDCEGASTILEKRRRLDVY